MSADTLRSASGGSPLEGFLLFVNFRRTSHSFPFDDGFAYLIKPTLELFLLGPVIKYVNALFFVKWHT